MSRGGNMIHVWKCGYCSEINEDKKEIALHEKTCVWNPKIGSCYTCRHRHQYKYRCYMGIDTYDLTIRDCEKWVTNEV